MARNTTESFVFSHRMRIWQGELLQGTELCTTSSMAHRPSTWFAFASNLAPCLGSPSIYLVRFWTGRRAPRLPRSTGCWADLLSTWSVCLGHCCCVGVVRSLVTSGLLVTQSTGLCPTSSMAQYTTESLAFSHKKTTRARGVLGKVLSSAPRPPWHGALQNPLLSRTECD